MAAALVAPVSALSLDRPREVVLMPPSTITQHSPRHGRSRGAGLRGAGAKASRRYSVVEDPDMTLCKALSFVLKRSVSGDELASDLDEEARKLVLVVDEDGWVNAQHVLGHPRISALGVTIEDVQRVIAAKPGRLSLRPTSSADADAAASHELRLHTPRRDSLGPAMARALDGPALCPDDAEGLPAFVVYETSYSRYPLILASGAIRRAAGTAQTVFVSAPAAEDGSRPVGEADVGIWLHLRSAMEADETVVWQRHPQTGLIFTQAEVPRRLWTRVVARRPDIGVLLENGDVKKEIPAGLRGKGAKGKTKKGKGSLKGKAEDASGSASEE